MGPQEKRTATRKNRDHTAYYRDIQATELPYAEGVLRDLSESGVSYRGRQAIVPNSYIKVAIHLNPHQTIDAVVHTAWVKEYPERNEIETGGRFVSLSDADRDAIRDHLI